MKSLTDVITLCTAHANNTQNTQNPYLVSKKPFYYTLHYIFSPSKVCLFACSPSPFMHYQSVGVPAASNPKQQLHFGHLLLVFYYYFLLPIHKAVYDSTKNATWKRHGSNCILRGSTDWSSQKILHVIVPIWMHPHYPPEMLGHTIIAHTKRAWQFQWTIHQTCAHSNTHTLWSFTKNMK